MNNNLSKTRSIVEAGLMAVMVFIIMMVVALVPGLGSFGSFILPVPITILYLRYDKKLALSCIIVSSILIGIFYNPIMALASAVYYGLIGLVLGYTVKNKKSSNVTFLFLFLSNLIGNLINLGLYIYIFMGINLNKVLQPMIDSFRDSAELMEKMGLNNEQNKQVIDAMKSIDMKMIMVMIPAAFILASLLNSFLNYVITKSILRRFKWEMESLPPFTHWYMDNRIGAFLIVCSCLGIILSSKAIDTNQYILNTAYSVLVMLLTLQGISILAFFLKFKAKMQKGFIIAICIFMGFSQLNRFLFLMGLIDLIMDIRGIDPNSLGNAIRNKFKAKNKQ